MADTGENRQIVGCQENDQSGDPCAAPPVRESAYCSIHVVPRPAGEIGTADTPPIRGRKSSGLSRCVRIVIAKHSPEQGLETGLPMGAPEKKRSNGRDAAPQSISLVRFASQNVGKIRPFSHISGPKDNSFSALETTWRR